MARDSGVIPQSYLYDNGGSFTSAKFTENLGTLKQVVKFAGVGAHHHNGHSEITIHSTMSIVWTIQQCTGQMWLMQWFGQWLWVMLSSCIIRSLTWHLASSQLMSSISQDGSKGSIMTCMSGDAQSMSWRKHLLTARSYLAGSLDPFAVSSWDYPRNMQLQFPWLWIQRKGTSFPNIMLYLMTGLQLWRPTWTPSQIMTQRVWPDCLATQDICSHLTKTSTTMLRWSANGFPDVECYQWEPTTSCFCHGWSNCNWATSYSTSGWNSCNDNSCSTVTIAKYSADYSEASNSHNVSNKGAACWSLISPVSSNIRRQKFISATPFTLQLAS